jgi:hypothetical protein
MKKYSISNSSIGANTPETEKFKFNFWDSDIMNFIKSGNMEGLEGYIRSKDEEQDMDFQIFLRSRIGHYGYLLNTDEYSGFLKLLMELKVVV